MAYQGFGSDLEKGDTLDYGTSTSWTSVGCITEVSVSGSTVEDINVPLCLNAASRAKETLPGGYDPGDVQYTILFAAGDIQDAINALGDFGAWRIKLSNSGRYFAFNGFFKQYSIPQITENGFVSVQCTIKISGEPAEVTGS